MTHTDDEFADVPWSRDTNIYEVNVRQYTPEGTLAASERELPRLARMGVGIVWLMPVQPIGVIERKGTLGSYYAIRDYCAVNLGPPLGDLALGLLQEGRPGPDLSGDLHQRTRARVLDRRDRPGLHAPPAVGRDAR